MSEGQQANNKQTVARSRVGLPFHELRFSNRILFDVGDVRYLAAGRCSRLGRIQAWLATPRGNLEADCESRMSEDAIRLTNDQRLAVEAQIKETCRHRDWVLHAVNCRSNHVHVLVSAVNTPPKKVRLDLKAYATRCLNTLDPSRDNWWAERGSIRWVYTDNDLEAATIYVIDGQTRKPEA